MKIEVGKKFVVSTVLLFFFAHASFAKLVGNITVLAPDEKNYFLTYLEIYDGNFSFTNRPGWQGDSYHVVRLLLFPARIFESLGIDSLLSLRLTSILYVSISLYQLLTLINSHKKNFSVLWIPIACFCIPSFFVFTSLAIRESFVYFLMINVFLNLFKLTRNQIQDYPSLLKLILFSYFLVKIKYYIFLFILCSFLIVQVFQVCKSRLSAKNFFTLFGLLIPLAISPATILNVYDLVPHISGRFFYEGQDRSKTNQSVLVESTSNLPAPSNGSNETKSPQSEKPPTSIEIKPEVKKGDSNKSDADFTYSILQAQLFGTESTKQNFPVSQLQALVDNLRKVTISEGESAIPRPEMGNFSSILKSIAHFLFGPYMIVSYQSSLLQLLTLDSMLSTVFMFVMLIYIIKADLRALVKSGIELVLILSSILFVIFSAFLEDNLGTSLRHRGVLLVLLTLSCVFATLRNQPKVKLSIEP
jgi:hypothetical protein